MDWSNVLKVLMWILGIVAVGTPLIYGIKWWCKKIAERME